MRRLRAGIGRRISRIAYLVRAAACALPLLAPAAACAEPETVYFKSADGVTEIVGYLFKPDLPRTAPCDRHDLRPRRSLFGQ